MSSKEFKLLKLKIQEVVPSEQRAFVSARLRNDPTLAQRIEFVVQKAGAEASDILKGYGHDFLSKIVRTRNGLSHSGRKGESFSWVELFWARNSILYVLQGAMLAELGFDVEEIEQRLARSVLCEELKSARNPLTIT